MIRTLSLDLETRSSVDLAKCGVYRYCESTDFDILLFGVSVDSGPVTVYDLACGEIVPEEILAALSDDRVTKWAYNAAFERVCLSVWLSRNYPEHFRSYSIPGDPVQNYLDPASWKCTLVWAAYNGLPLGLEKVGAVLGFEEQKLKEGKELVKYFCCPCRPTKSNGGRTWNLPHHALERWELFKRYNERDVQVEMQIQDRLKNYPVPDFVWDEYHLDQEINDRGIMIDQDMVRQALRIDELSRYDLTARMQKKTGLENPNSVMQMKDYLAGNGMEVDSLGKKDVAAMIKTAPEALAEVLELRLQLAKSSVRKYQAMQNAVCADGRCHGMFQFYGANRSGRWAGRLIQLQNLYRNSMPDLEQARDLVKAGDYDTLDMLYDSVPEVLAELVRTSFIPRPGYKFIVSDFSAIEARVLSHLAGEEWRTEVFREGRDIYCESASRMFGCVVEKHGQNSHLRQRGKIAELALGYGGSVGALKAMGATDMGIPEEELQPLVDMWRSSNPHITQYWWAVDAAVKEAISLRTETQVSGITFVMRKQDLNISLNVSNNWKLVLYKHFLNNKSEQNQTTQQKIRAIYNQIDGERVQSLSYIFKDLQNTFSKEKINVFPQEPYEISPFDKKGEFTWGRLYQVYVSGSPKKIVANNIEFISSKFNEITAGHKVSNKAQIESLFEAQGAGWILKYYNADLSLNMNAFYAETFKIVSNIIQYKIPFYLIFYISIFKLFMEKNNITFQEDDDFDINGIINIFEDGETPEEYARLIDYGLPFSTVGKIADHKLSINNLKTQEYDLNIFDDYERIIISETMPLL